jgi:hypothetical protein
MFKKLYASYGYIFEWMFKEAWKDCKFDIVDIGVCLLLTTVVILITAFMTLISLLYVPLSIISYTIRVTIGFVKTLIKYNDTRLAFDWICGYTAAYKTSIIEAGDKLWEEVTKD